MSDRLFPDPNRAGYSLHPPMTCTVLAIFNSHTHVAESIEAVDIHGKMKITHTIQRQGLKASDGFLVPYVENIHIERGEYKRYRLRFQGSHKVKIEGHGKIKRFPISPIYVCENRDGTSRMARPRCLHFPPYADTFQTSGHFRIFFSVATSYCVWTSHEFALTGVKTIVH